ncbi:MAG TPA: bifunctional YncE family protein/alkaline phosphatase family protein [Planosporangium sp.]|nr:bifunctional YncE family protein/alkaline phosphatase family protein [Planosporangium sp.]
MIATSAAAAAYGGWLDSQKVGRQADGSIVTSTGQRLTPAGQQVEFTGRPVDVAVRPDGKTAAFLNAQGSLLVVLDIASHRVLQTYGVSGASASFAGIAYSADGTQLYASSSNGKIVRAAVGADGTVTAAHTIALTGGKNANPYPGGLAPSADGHTLYVALSQDNALGVVDLGAEKLATEIPVGNAPHAVVLAGGKAYVTDQGGRPAAPGDLTNDSARTAIVANRQTGGVATGAVSVVDLAAGRTLSTIPTGLQPTGAVLHGGALFVANSLDDTVSVIDTRTDRTVQTIDVQPVPKAPLGSEPNAVTFVGENTLAVSLGRNNAVALYTWKGTGKTPAFQGLVPTGWYPTAVAVDGARNRLLVANGKGVGSLGPADSNGGHPVQALIGSASSVPLPRDKALETYTGQVLANDNLSPSKRENQPRRNAAPVPVPARVGEPSTIKHVFYVIKENRTYDQVLGDAGRGNSDPSLVQFGQQVTPNQHALAQRFPLLDNFYADGDLSADGHQWAVQANVPDYLEKAFGGFVRSYPYNAGDAMAYTKSGFLWDDALAHRKSVSIFGEYANEFGPTKGQPFGSWQDWYHDYQVMSGQAGGTVHAPPGSFAATSDVPQANKLLYHDFPNFQMGIPDQYRAQLFKQQFDTWVKQKNLPDLVVMHLPDDHTAGASRNLPTPRAMVADNDLAVGKLVDWISHSPYWKDSAIFVTEDDSQAGVDHVDGHRTTGYVISPWTRTGVVDSRFGSQVNMVRTIEQILGLPPMNQMDLAATPMRDLFTTKPDLRPYTAVPNQVPLDEMNPGSTVQPTSGASAAPVAATASMTPMQKLWADASDAMRFTDPTTPPDQSDWSVLNHAIWYATKGYDTPYPGDQKVLTPGEASSQHDGVQPGNRAADGDK